MGYDEMGFYEYVPVAVRRRRAEEERRKLAKRGILLAPVLIDGRRIATTFWGKAWCDHLEGYSDFENRLPRGRTYVRNGSVVDLQVASGKVTAKVQGSSLYTVTIGIDAASPQRWAEVVRACSGKVGSVIELLQGKLARGVMEVITSREAGLLPAPKEIRMGCSCPDSARMCKHVAAALYGVGARLDEKPELLFVLRNVDPGELVAKAVSGGVLRTAATVAKDKVLAGADLSSMFGIELDADGDTPAPAAPPKKPPPRAAAGSRKKPAKSAAKPRGKSAAAAARART
jgi:uncharacterized Zn finger protein